jgi:hypothetical protein
MSWTKPLAGSALRGGLLGLYVGLRATGLGLAIAERLVGRPA